MRHRWIRVTLPGRCPCISCYWPSFQPSVQGTIHSSEARRYPTWDRRVFPRPSLHGWGRTSCEPIAHLATAATSGMWRTRRLVPRQEKESEGQARVSRTAHRRIQDTDFVFDPMQSSAKYNFAIGSSLTSSSHPAQEINSAFVASKREVSGHFKDWYSYSFRIWKESVYSYMIRKWAMRISLRRRRGVSSLVAEIALIAVVLITTVVFASFTFGIFSFYYSPPEIAVEVASCYTAGNSTTCQLTLANMGARDTSTTGSCSLNVGTAVSGLVVNGGVVPAGGSLANVQCVTHGVDPSPGSQVTGALPLDNGGIAFFVGRVE